MKPVLGLVALLAVALLGLVMLLRGSPADDAPPAGPAAPPSTRPAPHPGTPPAPVASAGAPASAAPAPTSSTTYTIGDVIVRDHRPSGERLTEPPDFTPPGGVHLSDAYAQRVTDLMADPAKQCLQTIPSAARTDSTKLNVTMTVAVKNGSLTVTDVAAAVPGLEDSVVAPTLGCLRERMVGRNVDAAGQPDVPSYLISTYYTAQ